MTLRRLPGRLLPGDYAGHHAGRRTGRRTGTLRTVLLLVGLGAGTVAPAQAQRVSVGDPLEDYIRILQVAGRGGLGSFTVRPLPFSTIAATTGVDPWGALPSLTARDSLGGGLWFAGVQASAHGYMNSAFPWAENDGATWQGKGLTASFEGGGTLGFGPVTVTLRPTLAYAQNGDFALARPDVEGDAVYRYPWTTGIDAPQRFGPDPVTILDPGQSSIRVALRGGTVGFGTENLWWGPGRQQALLMTNNAAGFPHVDLGTDGPVDIGIGTFEAQWVWGRLYHSDWWAGADTARNRFFTGAVLAFSPAGVSGLTLGASRAFYRELPEGRLRPAEYLLVFQSPSKESFVTPDNPYGDDIRDQMVSAFARWVFPSSGLEIYGEYGRNDHGWNLRDYFLEPEHSRAYLWGLNKVSARPDGRLISFSVEVTQLEGTSTSRVRAAPPWYQHHIVPQGYTQRGQVIGSGLGPGGNAQFVGVDLFHPDGRFGAFLRRRVQDNDAFYRQASNGDAGKHHVSLDLGATALFRTTALEFGLGGTLTRDFNRYFIEHNDVWNAHLEASATWRRR